MFSLAAEPKRWIKVTAPLSASLDSSPARSIRNRVSTRCTTCRTGVSGVGCAASNSRSGIGSEGVELGSASRAHSHPLLLVKLTSALPRKENQCATAHRVHPVSPDCRAGLLGPGDSLEGV
jgi:hypothetical protein